MRKHKLIWFLAIIILGALIGSALGEVLGLILPHGVVREFFLRAASFGFGPANINLIIISFTIGLKLKINIIGVLGIALASYFLRFAD